MAKNLVIVESPAKAKTINKYLGKDFVVKSSMGHIRDLPKSKLGIDVEGDFSPQYIQDKKKSKTIADLKKSIGKDTTVWIATDEDREGEAIGWHLCEILKLSSDTKRIVFHEITKTAIKAAIAEPRTIDMKLVDAQQARRVLDRIVGYELSPLLWKKIRYGLSAGRVQSVAVRLIVEREREIDAFDPVEYWTISAIFTTADGEQFKAELAKIAGQKAELGNKKITDQVLAALKDAAYTITRVTKKETKRNPAAPFTTSTLQQEASRKLGFGVKKTMMVAQKLYEGISTGGDAEGLITYMRTDSVNLSDQILAEAREAITTQYGAEYALDTPRVFKSKKGAQEAHEAIRPTSVLRSPDDIAEYLDRDQFRLYDLIYKRTLACQMASAVLDSTSVDITATTDQEYTFRATGQIVRFAGFMKVYLEGTDDEDNGETPSTSIDKLLPPLKEKDQVDCNKIDGEQHFTKPPPRYTEASLVKKLESEGIGRPSTYAPTISTIIARGYVEKEAKTLRPTDTAYVVIDLLVEHFPKNVDYKFTATMEEDLDQVAEGQVDWREMMKKFYAEFHALVTEKSETIKKSDFTEESTDEKCDKCGAAMVIKLSRYGKFLSCSAYPECKNAKPLPEDQKAQEELAAQYADEKCPECGAPVQVKHGRFGDFLGCTKYPDCKGILKIEKGTGVTCVKCGKGEIIEKKSRAGKIFYGCNKYPKCDAAYWSKPTGDKCPKCDDLLVETAKTIKCGNKECDYTKDKD